MALLQRGLRPRADGRRIRRGNPPARFARARPPHARYQPQIQYAAWRYGSILSGTVGAPGLRGRMPAHMAGKRRLAPGSRGAGRILRPPEDTQFAYLSHAARALLNLADRYPERRASIEAFLLDHAFRPDFRVSYSLKEGRNLPWDATADLQNYIRWRIQNR